MPTCFSETSWRGVLVPAVLCTGVVLVYLPSAQTGFFSDDLLLLAQSGTSFSAASLLQPFSDQLQPLFRAFFRLEYLLFGMDAAPYHYVSMGLHALNALLAALLVAKLAGRAAGLSAGALFGFSSGYAQAVTWITCQGQLLAVACMLGALRLFLEYLETRQKKFLVLSAAAHLGMLASFGYGLELPAALALLLFAASRRARAEGREGWTTRAGLYALLPYLANCALFLGAHLKVATAGAQLFNSWQGAAGLLAAVPAALLREATAVTLRLLYPFFMVFPPPAHFFQAAVWVASALALTLAALDLGGAKLREQRFNILAFGTLAALLYFWPALARQNRDFAAFVGVSRYAYAPGAAAAAAFALALTGLKCFARDSAAARRWRAALAALALVILANNCLLIRERTRVIMDRRAGRAVSAQPDFGILHY